MTLTRLLVEGLVTLTLQIWLGQITGQSCRGKNGIGGKL